VSWYRQLVLASATLVILGLPATAVTAAPAPVTQWRSGLTELDRDWLEHEGDKMEWSRPEFDDSGWNTVDLGDPGPAQPLAIYLVSISLAPFSCQAVEALSRDYLLRVERHSPF
jgi:hypothetical protein